MASKSVEASPVDVSSLIFGETIELTARGGKRFEVVKNWPEIHVLNDFVGGHLRTRGTDEGQYPLPYLEMIEGVFGREPDTMEVCSRHVKADGVSTSYTVDINPAFNPTFLTDGQTLAGIKDNFVRRIRMDPPYNPETAKKMYNCTLPSFYKLLEAAGRVVKPGGLIFLLLGPDNYQINVDRLGLKRIGLITLSVVPNYELRACNIFYKLRDVPAADKSYQTQL